MTLDLQFSSHLKMRFKLENVLEWLKDRVFININLSNDFKIRKVFGIYDFDIIHPKTYM